MTEKEEVVRTVILTALIHGVGVVVLLTIMSILYCLITGSTI